MLISDEETTMPSRKDSPNRSETFGRLLSGAINSIATYYVFNFRRLLGVSISRDTSSKHKNSSRQHMMKRYVTVFNVPSSLT